VVQTPEDIINKKPSVKSRNYRGVGRRTKSLPNDAENTEGSKSASNNMMIPMKKNVSVLLTTLLLAGVGSTTAFIPSRQRAFGTAGLVVKTNQQQCELQQLQR